MDLHLIGFMHHKEQQVVLLLAACQLLWPLKELHMAAAELLKSLQRSRKFSVKQQTCRAKAFSSGPLFGRRYSRQCRICTVRFLHCSSKLTLGATHQNLKGVEPLQAAPGPRLIQRLQI